MPSAVRIGELPEGPVDRLKRDSSRESKESIQLKGEIERSCERTSTRGPSGFVSASNGKG